MELKDAFSFSQKCPVLFEYFKEYIFSKQSYIKKNKITKKIRKILMLVLSNKDVKELISNKYNNINLLFARFYKPLDNNLLLNYSKKCSKIIIYDIYSTKHGLYDDVCTFLMENNVNVEIINMTLPNDAIGHGKISELLTKLNLSISDLDNKLGD